MTYSAYGKPRANKNTNFIEYPEALDIAPYMVDPKSTGTQYRLFGVTCHRGQELRFGHYTSYVRGPQGSWYHADDEDMTSSVTSEVLKQSSAYLLSYIRVGDNDPAVTSTPQPTSAKSTPLRANGHANGHTPSAASSPPQKRKRQWAANGLESDDEEPLTPFKSQTTWSPAYRPSDEEEDQAQEQVGRKWTYDGSGSSKKKQRPNHNMPAPRASIPELNHDSPIRRPSHPSPGAGASRAERRQMRKQMRKGAPQPFKVGGASSSSTPNGGKNGTTSAFRRGDRKPLQPRKPKDGGNNGRRAFKG